MSKVKILVFGAIGDNSDLFIKKLDALHKSKAGPFDAAFATGVCSSLSSLRQASLPLPVYLHHVSEPLSEDLKQEGEDPYLLAPNLFLLVRNIAGIWSLKVGEGSHADHLVVAACPPHLRVDSDAAKPLLEKLQHVSYRGCDILLSEEPPQGSESLLSASSAVSFDVADVALKARARYHFYPSKTYQQSPPFQHLASTTSTVQILHTGRLISLGAVSSLKDKAAKCVHALGMTPLLSLSTIELQQQQQQGLLPCPFTDASYPTDRAVEIDARGPAISTGTSTAGLSEASARRILAEERDKRDGSSALAHRWALNKSKRRRNGDMDDEQQQQQANDPSSTTLFVHGLHKDVSGRLQSQQGDILLLQAFSKWKAVRVRKPPNATTSSFAFVEFPSHEIAVQCLQETGRELVITGVHLTLKWATTSASGGDAASSSKKRREERLTEAQAKDSNTLYFKLVQMEINETNGEAMEKWAEVVLEAALNENIEEDEDRVTAQDEPALRVHARIMESFGFLDFASHAAASMAIATLTGSVDGGQVLDDAKNRPDRLKGANIYMHWAQAKAPQQEETDKNLIEDASGFKFERKHFPPDSRQDCWFCLASESCEKHLITAVFDQCYAAMPKGPVHPGHLLLIPVQHSSQGSLKNAQVAEEMEDIKSRLRQHASSAYDCDLFVFERAMQTKGGYHTHVQCVPVERQLGKRLLTTMMAQGTKTGMDMKEINSDIGASALLDSDDGDEAGYFYAEIPVSGSLYRRFLHRHVSGSRANVPLQFGREALAAVLGKPELAHWKSCVLDQEQEAKLASEFRESFAKVN